MPSALLRVERGLLASVLMPVTRVHHRPLTLYSMGAATEAWATMYCKRRKGL